MSDTPRTESCLSGDYSDAKCLSLLIKESRKLERELAHAKADAESWAQQAEDRLQDVLRIAKERDDALERVKRITETADKYIHALQDHEGVEYATWVCNVADARNAYAFAKHQAKEAKP